MGSEKMNSSRRVFLKRTFALAGTCIAVSSIRSFSAVVFAANAEEAGRPWYGIGIDITKCIGCGKCAVACKEENNVPREPFFFRTWIEHYTLKNDGSIKVESPNGGIDGFKQSEPEEEIYKTFFVPKMCNHCEKSPCTQVCPVGAAFETPDGVNLVDDKYCIGCRYCIQACPYGCRYLHPQKKTVDKCTLCYHRIKKGLLPACMEICPTKARIYGDLNDKKGELYKFLKKNNCLVLKPHLNTSPKLFYNGLNAEVR